VHFTIPDDLAGLSWEIVLNSAAGLGTEMPVEAQELGDVEGWSVLVARRSNGVTG
jgi:hypothetical protein